MTVREASATEPLVWIDDQLSHAQGRHVSALDRGFTLADGVFETMRVYGSRVFRLDAHLARLANACRVMRIDVPARARDAIEGAVAAAARAGLRDARLRLTVTRGVGAAGLAPPRDASPTVIVTVHPLAPRDESPYDIGIGASIATTRLNEHAATAGLKTLAYADMVLALAEAADVGADDAILRDTRDHVATATASNLFIVDEGTLVTPPLSCGVLPGITRAAVIECARAAGLTAIERELITDDLRPADEAFLTNSIREIVPLVRIGGSAGRGSAIGTGRPGAITRSLMESYAALVRRECAS